MEKIKDLTPEQDAKLEQYYEKWLKIGLQSRPTTDEDREIFTVQINKLYKQEGMNPPKVIWTRSPIEGALKCVELGDKESNLQWSASYGAHDANWFGYYDFMSTELGLVEECKDLAPLIEISKHVGWYWGYENAVIVSELPLQTNVNADGDLHNFNGPAIEWSDGEALYYFNGVEVPKEMAMKKVDEVTKGDIITQENADIRREIIKKIGIQKAIELLGATTIATLDCPVGGHYELLSIDYDGTGQRPYLKMQNPSLAGTYHIEGVHRDVKTCEQALAYRNGLKTWISPRSLS